MVKVLKKRERQLVCLIIALVSAGIFFNLFAYPFLQKNQSLNSEIAIAKLKLIKYQEILNRKDELKKNPSERPSGLTVFEQKQDTVVAILAELEHLSKGAGVKILDIRPQNLITASKNENFTFDLRLEGNIEGYLKFIYEIENSVFLLQIKKMLLRAKTVSALIEGSFTVSQISRD